MKREGMIREQVAVVLYQDRQQIILSRVVSALVVKYEILGNTAFYSIIAGHITSHDLITKKAERFTVLHEYTGLFLRLCIFIWTQ